MHFVPALLAFVGLLIALVVFSDAAFSNLTNRWSTQEEYSHGFLIPIVTVWLLWMRRDALRASIQRPAWTGPIVILLAMAMHAVGEMSAIPILSQVGFIVALIGLDTRNWRIFVVEDGNRSDIVFAVRNSDASLHRFRNVSSNFSSFHRNSEAFFIRMFRIPVYLDGNVIDLGNYQASSR